MIDRSRINFEPIQKLERQLEPGESVCWADQPVKRYFTPFTVTQLIVGLLWTGIVLAVLSHSYEFQWPAFDRWQDFTYAVFLSPFFLFGFYFIWAPIRECHRTVHSVYAITDRRALSLWNRRKPVIRTYPFAAISQIRIAERRGGLGDVIIVTGVRVVGETSDEDKQGFYHIRNAREVAKCLEQQIGAASTKKGTGSQEALRESPFETTGKPPLIVKDDAEKPPIRGLPRMLLPPAFLLSIAALLLLVFGLPAALAWATNTGVAGFVFFLVAFVLSGQVRHICRAKKSINWPTTPGVIKESFIRSDDENGYNPRVRFIYQVNGKEYESSEISTKQRSDTLNRKPAEAIIAQYPEGLEVSVYYDPRDPGYGVLEPGQGVGNWVVLAILAPCMAASGIWMAVAWEGFDAQRFGQKWQEVKQVVGLEPSGEENKPPASVVLPAQQDPAFVGKRFKVTSQHLWVNSAPFGGNAVIGDLPNGAVVKVYTERKIWALVQTQPGQGGWVLRQSLEEIEEPPPETTAATGSDRPPPDAKNATISKTPPATASMQRQTKRSPVNRAYRAYPAQDVERFFLAVVDGRIDVVKRYIEGGISPNLRQPNNGDLPLFLAISHGQDDVALLLIDAGADVDGNKDMGIPLIWAAEHCNSVKLVRTLLDAGADVNATARGGATPLMMAKAFRCSEIEEMLMAAGAH